MVKKKKEKFEDRLTRYRALEDHDILVIVGTRQEFIEEHLNELNGSVKANAKKIAKNDAAIQLQQNTCVERSKTVFNRLDKSESPNGLLGLLFTRKTGGIIAGIVSGLFTAIYFIIEVLSRAPP